MVLAALAGSSLLAAAIFFSGEAAGHAPPLAVAVAAAICLPFVLSGSSRLVESPWRIPRSWARFGSVPYAVLFGSILGVGFLTALPSISFYVVVVATLSATSWKYAFVVLAAFALGRIVPVPIVGLSGVSRERQFRTTERLQSVARRLGGVEVALLASVAAAFIV